MINEILLYENITGKQSLYFSNGNKVDLNSVNFIPQTNPWYSVKVEDFTKLTSTDFFKNFKSPFLIYHNGFECPQMASIQYSDSEKEILNNQGLHIFLTENLVKYIGNRNYITKKDISDKILEFKPGINFSVYGDLRCSQFDSIQDLIDNNDLTNVHVYCIEMNVEQFFSKKYPKIKFHWKDVYISEPIEYMFLKTRSEKTKINYKFLNYNWRYDFHRDLIASYLTNKSSKISWYYKSNIVSIKNALWFDLDSWKNKLEYSLLKQGMEKLANSVPINLDKEIAVAKSLKGNMLDVLTMPDCEVPYSINSSIFDDVFCSVVSESVYAEPTSSISEKTLLSIYNSTPFIVVGTPGALKYLKKLGFKTFSNYWPEMYDDEYNHADRMLKIFDTINFIDLKSIEDLSAMYQDMKPIIEFNLHRLIELRKNNQWLNSMQ